LPGSSADTPRDRPSSRRAARENGSAPAAPGADWPGADGDHWPASSAQGSGATAFDTPGSPGAPSEGWPGSPAQDFGATGAFDVPGSSAAGQPDAPRGRRSSWRGDNDSGSIADWLGSAQDPGAAAAPSRGSATASPSEWPGADGGRAGDPAQDFGAADFGATAAFHAPGSSGDGQPNAPRGRRSSWRGDEDSGSIADWLGSAQDPGAAGAPGRGSAAAHPASGLAPMVAGLVIRLRTLARPGPSMFLARPRLASMTLRVAGVPRGGGTRTLAPLPTGSARLRTQARTLSMSQACPAKAGPAPMVASSAA